MTTETTDPNDIRIALQDASIPEFGNPEYKLSIQAYDEDKDTDVTHYVWPGDVLERNPPASDRSKYWVVIDLTDDAVIYYVPDDHRYGSYYQMFLSEDLTEGTIAYHKQLLSQKGKRSNR